MFEVQEALDAQKEEFARREEAFRRREDGLRKKDLDLQTTLINYNKIITNNEAKRQRALQRATQERNARLAKEDEARQLTDQLLEEEKRLLAMRSELQELSRYREFLVEVQQRQPDEFPELPQVEQRFHRLATTNEQLKEESTEKTDAVLCERQRLESLRATDLNQRLTQTLEASQLTLQYESTHEKAEDLLRSETEVSIRQSDRVSEFSIVLNAVDNLYLRCTSGPFARGTRHITHRTDSGSNGGAAETAGGGGGGGMSSPKAKEPPLAGGKKRAGKRETRGERDMYALVGEAAHRLDVVRAYLQDFSEIVHCWETGELLPVDSTIPPGAVPAREKLQQWLASRGQAQHGHGPVKDAGDVPAAAASASAVAAGKGKSPARGGGGGEGGSEDSRSDAGTGRLDVSGSASVGIGESASYSYSTNTGGARDGGAHGGGGGGQSEPGVFYIRGARASMAKEKASIQRHGRQSGLYGHRSAARKASSSTRDDLDESSYDGRSVASSHRA